MKLQIISAVIFTMMLSVICNFLFGQTLQYIKNQVDSNNFEIAIEALHQYQEEHNNEKEALLLASELYLKLARSTDLNSLVTDPIQISFSKLVSLYNIDNQYFIEDNYKIKLDILNDLQSIAYHRGMSLFAYGKENHLLEYFKKAANAFKLAKSITDFKQRQLKLDWTQQDKSAQIYFIKSLILIDNKQDALINAKIIFNNIDNFKDHLESINSIAQWVDDYYRRHQYDELFINFNHLAGTLFCDPYFLFSKIEYYQTKKDTLAQLQTIHEKEFNCIDYNKIIQSNEYQYLVSLYYNYIFGKNGGRTPKSNVVNAKNLLLELERGYKQSKSLEIGFLFLKARINLLMFGTHLKNNMVKKDKVDESRAILSLCDEIRLQVNCREQMKAEIQLIKQRIKSY